MRLSPHPEGLPLKPGKMAAAANAPRLDVVIAIGRRIRRSIQLLIFSAFFPGQTRIIMLSFSRRTARASELVS